MDSTIQQSITGMAMSVITIAVASILVKHDSMILFLDEMIEKSLLLKNLPSTISLSDPNTSAWVSTPNNAS